MRFNFLKATEPLREDIYFLPLSFQELVPGTHFIDLGRMSHAVVLNTGPLDCESSAITTRFS